MTANSIPQKPPYYNPLDLKLGQTIKTSRTCMVEYLNDEKQIIFKEHSVPKELIIVGVKKRALGAYIPTPQFSHPEDADDGPSLKVSKYVWLYQAKAQINGNTCLVHPDDIKVEGDY